LVWTVYAEVVLTTKRQTTAFLVLAFFSIAVLCAESTRAAGRSLASINATRTEKGHAPAGQRKALKRTVYVEEAPPPSDSVRMPSRYLTSKRRRFDFNPGFFKLLLVGTVPAQKVSTNLFLSVLNL
jgi:hypothetical protein